MYHDAPVCRALQYQSVYNQDKSLLGVGTRTPSTPSWFWSLFLERRTCDIWGLKLISFRSTDPGERLCNIWHRSTPSRSAWAKSNTTAEGHTTRWFGGRTLQSINHRPHCLHSSIPAPGDSPRKLTEPWNCFTAGGELRFSGHEQALCVGFLWAPGVSMIHCYFCNDVMSQL